MQGGKPVPRHHGADPLMDQVDRALERLEAQTFPSRALIAETLASARNVIADTRRRLDEVERIVHGEQR